MNKTFYVTTPIYYANSLPHLGHLYTTIVADALARYKRQLGLDTYFLTGTDEHGINIQRAAEKNNRTPKEQVDYIASELQKMFHEFGLDGANGGYDIFMRTSFAFHYEGAQELWRRAAKAKTPKGNDAIYKSFYEGWFCAACATFKTEDEYAKAENENEPPRCLVHETPLDKVEEESYFFRLSDYDEVLLNLYETRPDFVRPEGRKNEVISFVKAGLQDLSVSRLKSSVSWGIPVPDDEKHTMYVWFDALSNYITALGFGNKEKSGFEKYWSGLHLVGKDILRQHAIYWPAFLLAAGVELPVGIFAHGLLLDPQGRKMSKTIGNTIELPILHRYFTNDMIRYFVLREVVFGQDGKIGYENLIDRSNSDLASGLGNLSSRTLTMVEKYRDGAIPSGKISEQNYLNAKRANVDSDPQSLASALALARDQFVSSFDDFAFSRALETAWSVIARVDKMISDAKPWELVKDETQTETLNAVLYRACETLRWLCVLLYPVMPEATKKIYSQLGLSEDISKIDPTDLKWGGLAEGTKLGEIQAVFPRLDKKKIMSEIEQGKEIKEEVKTETVEEKKEESSFIEVDDFVKVELRVGEIMSAERLPKSDKLLIFTVDVGEEKPRTILAGLAEYYTPEEMIGKKVVVVANLAPRKLRGYESQGMICAASFEGGKPVIATFTEDVPNGARLK
jgi:methionyl-tRNA synthetase